MTRSRFKALHRAARLGALGSLSAATSRSEFQWFVDEVYETRFPRIGTAKFRAPRSFDVLAN